MDDNENEINRIFSDQYLKNIKENMNGQQFMEQFDKEFNKYIDEKEEELRTPFEQMITNYRVSLEKAKQSIYDRFKMKEIKSIQQIKQSIKDLVENDNSQDKQKAAKEQIDCCNQIDEIKKTLDQMMDQLKQSNQQAIKDSQKLFEALTQKQAQICGKYSGANLQHSDANLQDVRQLKQSNNYITIQQPNKLDEYKNKIKEMKQQNKQYYINLYFCDSNASLELKQQIMNMVDELGVNHKVGRVEFQLSDDNELNADLIMKMTSKYHNLWWIWIHDGCNQVDNDIHDQLKIMVTNSTVLNFTLGFSNDQGLKLLKEYNEIIRTKIHLEHLHYGHSKMSKKSSDKQVIEQMIETVSNV